jgi:hypothetical protein
MGPGASRICAHFDVKLVSVLYFCTSKASKLVPFDLSFGLAPSSVPLLVRQYVYVCASKASKLSKLVPFDLSLGLAPSIVPL